MASVRHTPVGSSEPSNSKFSYKRAAKPVLPGEEDLSGEVEETGRGYIPTPPATSSPEPLLSEPAIAIASEEQREFNALGADKKLARLRFLIERSTVYASILSDRLQQQQEEKARLESLTEKKKAAKSATFTSKSAVTCPSSTRQVSGDSSRRKSPRKSKKKEAGKSNYSILDYISKEELDTTKATADAFKDVATDSDNALSKPISASARQPSLITGGIMKDYQLAGLEWLVSLYENGLNGILADEMGLGKTLQTIAFLAFLREKGLFGPFLIVAPLSTLTNWISEIERFAPTIPKILYHGTPEDRAVMRDKSLFRKVDANFPIVVTSYNLIMNDQQYLRKLQWKYIVIDEGHRIKNMNCKLIKELKSYDSANRLLLTGTPLQNNLAELWSLLNFLLPDIFHDLELFQSWFDFSALQRKNGTQEIIDEENKNSIVSNLHAILKPFLLRRLKTDVELSLPPKREYILYAPLTPIQQEYYRHLISHDMKEYLIDQIMQSNGTTATPQPNKRRITESSAVDSSRRSKRRAVTKTLVVYTEESDDDYFDKVLNRPDSLWGTEAAASPEDFEDEAYARELIKANKSINNKKLQNLIVQLRLACNSPHLFYAPWDDPHSKIEEPDESIVNSSGKMLLMDRLVPELFKQGHKVLVFSQFRKMLDIIQDWAELLRGWKVCRLDGQVQQEDRRSQIDDFNSDPDHRLFLLSTRAGGLGINLTSADTVILFDSDWNPQQDLQAMDRAHRIGQNRPVIVYRLATMNTVEQTMLEKADTKRQLEKLVIQKGKFRSLVGTAKSTSEDDLKRLLLGDEGLEKFVIKERGDVILTDQELEVLLDRSPSAYEPANNHNVGGSVFKVVDTAANANDILA